MKKLFILVFFTLSAQFLFAQLNIQLRANLSYGNKDLANIGGYIDHTGHEYALVGHENGLDIVDVTNPTNPLIKFTAPGNQSSWREVKTYRDYAYVTTEACCGGLQIVDLSQLPNSINYKNYNGDGTISGQIRTIHALHIDTAKAFLYLFGSNISGAANDNGYPLIINISNPWNPTYAGRFIVPSGDAYVHDGYVLNDTGYFGHIYDGFVSIVDLRVKTAPVLLATQTTPGQFTHNVWLSDNHKVMFTTDEVSNSYLTAYDIADLSNITELSRFQTNPGSNSIVHNTHILNDYAVSSWYTQGVVITDVSRPSNPVEVGHYDTYPASNGGSFNGDWGVYPFLPSGNLVCSDINNGLFVLSPTYVRGCYLEGIVTDSLTGVPIQGATVQILTTTVSKASDIVGQYKSGTAAAGTYSVQVSKAAYITKTISGVTLNNGILTILNVQLSRIPIIPNANFSANTTSSCTGIVQFTDVSTNLPTAWRWDFGDGGSSTQQNPTHAYTSSGTYTVVLIATNVYGSDTLTQKNYIQINLPSSPIPTSVTTCPGNSATLSASGSAVLSWFTAATGGTAINTGNVFITPALSTTTTYYVESDIYPARQHVGPVDSTFGGGINYTATNYHQLYFNCSSPVTLVSIKVYAQGSGNRTITLIKNNVILDSLTVNIPDGKSRVTLNFPIPVGTNLELGIKGNVNLFRNSTGASFPYTLNGVVSITGTNAGDPNYYYYFYDWELQRPACISSRVPVTATVASVPNAAFTSNFVGTTGNFTDNSIGAVTNYIWVFGDPASGNNTSTLKNPTHIFSTTGIYKICLTVTNSFGCSDSTCKTIVVTSVGVAQIASQGTISVYPNPFSNSIMVNIENMESINGAKLIVTDALGKEVELRQINSTSGVIEIGSLLDDGIYFISFEKDGRFISTQKVVKIK